MRTLRLSLAGTVILMMLGGLAVGVMAESEVGEGVTVEVLSDVGVIPLEAIPEDADHVTYARISVEPGVSGQVGSAQPQEWASLEYQEAGSISATSDTPVRIWQVDGSVVDVPAGTPHEGRTGEVALFYNGGAASSAKCVNTSGGQGPGGLCHSPTTLPSSLRTWPRPALWTGDGPGRGKPSGGTGPEEGDPIMPTARAGSDGSACREPPDPRAGIAIEPGMGTSTSGLGPTPDRSGPIRTIYPCR